jgi:glycosyltransferase involved in cell wall biosynthesis
VTRLAFLSPLPPVPSGIADYSADVLRLLVDRYAVDCYCDQSDVDSSRLPAAVLVRPIEQLALMNAGRRYDLVVQQLGNGTSHAFQYPWLARLPGLLVLHDLVLHHSRARMFLDAPEARAYAARPWDAEARSAAFTGIQCYRDEVAYCYPAQAGRLDEAHLATVGTLLPYAYPLFRIPVEASRVTGVHNSYCADAIIEELPEARVVPLTMPVEPLRAPPGKAAELRRRYGIEPGDLVVASFGLLTREKRIETLARAVARALSQLPRLRLALVGPAPDRAGLGARLEELGLAGRFVITDRVPFDELGAHMEMADIAVHLRYPSAGETSASLLRLLAQGRPTLMADIENLSEVPEAAVVRIDVSDEEGEVTRAILRLAARPERARALGRAAAEFAAREHSPERCAGSYETAIATALEAPPPVPGDWPEHWRLPGPRGEQR